MKKLLSPMLFVVALNVAGALSAAEVPCYGQAWNVTTCKAISTKPNGQVVENTFVPQDKTARSCFLFGCDPVYCSHWRENIRNVCKSEYEAVTSRFFGMKPDEQGLVRFEGCAQRPMAKGVLGWFDSSMRKLAPDSFYNVCTTISPEEESKLKNFLNKIWNGIKRIHDDSSKRVVE